MKVEVKEDYTYEQMPEYSELVEGAKEIVMTGNEIGLAYFPDVIYDTKEGYDLHLQIIKPSIFNEPDRLFPCVVYIQGSAWKKQNVYQALPELAFLAKKGYVVAIVEYRHSGIAHFPAQIIDAKNAVRFLRKHASDYTINVDQMIIMGNSSGGHVSTMVGMTAKTTLFDEPINDEPLDLKGIIDLYGAVDVTLPYGFPTTPNHQLPDSPEGMLMGYNIREHEKEAKVACSKEYVDQDFAPVLILHGTKDRLVFAQESVDLYHALKQANKDVEFYFVKNADHGGAAFFDKTAVEVYDQFICKCLKKK